MSGPLRAALAVALGTTLALASALGRAEPAMPAGRPPRTVEIATPACATPPVPFAAFVEALRVELAGQGAPCCDVRAAGEPLSAEGFQVELAFDPCDPSGSAVTAEVTDPATGRAAERAISLGDVAPAARPRALALAVAEILRAVREPGPPPPAPAPPATTLAAPAPAASHRRALVGAAAELRAYPSHGTALFGAALSLASGSGPIVGGADLGAAASDQAATGGRIALRAGIAGLTLARRFAGRRAAAELGARAELGWVWIDGQSAGPGIGAASGSGWLAAAALRAALETPGTTWRVRATVDGGLVLRGVAGDANGAAAAGTSGPYLLLGLGFVFAPPG